jgi:hypothetical protein
MRSDGSSHHRYRRRWRGNARCGCLLEGKAMACEKRTANCEQAYHEAGRNNDCSSHGAAFHVKI